MYAAGIRTRWTRKFSYTTHWFGPPTTLVDLDNDFNEMLQDLWEDLGDIEGSSSDAPRHFPALSVGGAAPSNAGSSDQPRPVLNVQGDMTVFGTVRAELVLPMSDEDAKCNIHKSDHNALNTLSQLQIYMYQFKSNPEGRQVLGLLAQELEKVVPDFVETDHDGVKRVDFTSLLSLSLQAIQQLSAQQQDIDNCLTFLLLKISSLSRRLESSLQASITGPSRVEANSRQAVQQLARSAEPAMVEPATVEPAVVEPATAQATIAQATTADPATAQAATADPATAQDATPPVCGSATESKALPDFKDNDAMVRHMLEALGETNDGIHQWVLNRIADFDHQSVWESFQEALPQRNKGKTLFINSLKKKQQDLKMRSVAFHL